MVRLFSAVVCALLSLSCYAMCSANYRESFRYQLLAIAAKKPQYTFGGAESIEKGLDCSGYLYLAAKWAGIPGLRRSTAYRMSCGMDGWNGPIVEMDKISDCDIGFWAWRNRPNPKIGHTGAFIRNENDGELLVAHAGSRGVLLVPFLGQLRSGLSLVRSLEILK